VILIPVVTLICYQGGWLFAIAAILWTAKLLMEYRNMIRTRRDRNFLTILFPAVVLIMLACRQFGAEVGLAVFVALGLIIFSLAAARGQIQGAIGQAGEKLLVLFYLGLLPGYWILLRDLPLEFDLPYASGANWFLFAALITWIGDSCAYLVGVSCGRHKLGTPVSPNKTWEGVAGSFGGSLLGGWILSGLVSPLLSLPMILLSSILIALAALCGDLFESLLKRDYEVKDSGHHIPGHGGFLDRVDSMLFSIPVFYYFLILVIVNR
jgi:phosphatidate cytidylyltransferase